MSEHDEDQRPARTRSRPAGEVVPMPTADRAADTKQQGRGPLAFIERAQDVMTVKRVYGEPIERNGVTVIPAATVRGGGGGGGGEGEGPQAQRGRGWGGGFGVTASPAGAYVIRPDGTVKWRPAIDVNRTIVTGQLVAIVFLLTLRSVVKALARRR